MMASGQLEPFQRAGKAHSPTAFAADCSTRVPEGGATDHNHDSLSARRRDIEPIQAGRNPFRGASSGDEVVISR